jgi:uncharacterized protein involved in response to NO
MGEHRRASSEGHPVSNPLPVRGIPVVAAQPAGGVRVSSPPSPWRLQALWAAPHRLAFAAGVVMLGVASLWWALVLSMRDAGVPLPWALPPTTAHGAWMTFGFMPLFFVGFLFTAGPKWLGLPAVDARVLAAPLALKLAGWVLFLFGVHGAPPAWNGLVAGAGLAAAVLGWAAVVWRFARMVATSAVADRVHAKVVLAALVLGLGVWAAEICRARVLD